MSRSTPTVPGPRPQEHEAQGEWEACISPRRTYAAVNEVLSSGELLRFLTRFFRRVHAPRRCHRLAKLDERNLYEAFLTAIEGHNGRTWLLERAWLVFVKREFLEPPKGFVYVGKMANMPGRVPLEPGRLLEPHRILLNPAWGIRELEAG